MSPDQAAAADSIALAGRTALVTGAGGSIGKGIAAKLAAAGAFVVMADKDGDAAQAACATIPGSSCAPLALDVADEEAVRLRFAEIGETRGGIDILVNNAGVFPLATLDDIESETWSHVFAVNLKGAFHCMREAARQMPDGGSIINISSIDSLRASAPGLGHYAASKAGLNALTRAGAIEYGPRGIRVNAILPGIIRNERISAVTLTLRQQAADRSPARRIGEPEDIGNAALFLASSLADFVHGHLLIVDGGLSTTG